MATKNSKSSRWRGFQDFNNEVVTITKLEDSLLHIQAWKKDGSRFVPALRTIYTISPQASPAELGKVVQEIMNAAKEKGKWLNS